MLKKRERLTQSDFDRFFTSGRRYHSPFFTLIYAHNPSFHGAVVVPKKVEKSAVKRNKVRRQLYDILRRLGRGKQGGIYIMLLKKGTTEASYNDFKEEIEKLFGRIHGTKLK